eukprot:360838-Chlamydomonas_euryale.AAC.13
MACCGYWTGLHGTAHGAILAVWTEEVQYGSTVWKDTVDGTAFSQQLDEAEVPPIQPHPYLNSSNFDGEKCSRKPLITGFYPVSRSSLIHVEYRTQPKNWDAEVRRVVPNQAF